MECFKTTRCLFWDGVREIGNGWLQKCLGSDRGEKAERGQGRRNLFPALPAAWRVTPAKSLHCSTSSFSIYKMKTPFEHALFLVMESNMLTGCKLPSESFPGIRLAVWIKQHRSNMKLRRTTSTAGQMAEAPRACRL